MCRVLFQMECNIETESDLNFAQTFFHSVFQQTIAIIIAAYDFPKMFSHVYIVNENGSLEVDWPKT